MGPSTSTSLDKAALLSSYDEIDFKSQLGTVMSHKITKQTYLLKELNFPDAEDYKKALKINESKKDKVKENVLNLIGLENQSKSLFCSQIYRLSLIYEFSEITLTKEIEARQAEKRYFEEQDMWSILQSCLYGLLQLGDKMILQTNRVFIMADGLVKIIDSDLITNNSWYMLDQNLYYSPQRFENFDNSYKVNISLQDVMFSLGATLLNTAILEDIFDCYQYGSHRFNYERLMEKLNCLEKLYSKDFKNVIAGLVEGDVEKRLTIEELQEIVGKMMSQDTEEQNEGMEGSERKEGENEEHEEEYRESARDSIPESVRESLPNIYLTKQQRTSEPFREINNYHQQPTSIPPSKWDKPYYKQPQQFTIPSTIKFKNIQIKPTLQPILEQNATRQYTKFQAPHFSNFKEVEESQFESIIPRGHTNSQQYSVISKNINNSPPMVGYDGRLESIKNKNVSQFNPSHYQEIDEYVPMYKVSQVQNDENLFTDPRLMEQIRRDMSEITARRSLMPTPNKPNYSAAYSTYQQESSSGYYNNPSLRSQAHVQIQTPSQTSAPLLQKSKPKPSIHYESDGKIFQGTIINGLKHGHGKLSYPQGPYYLGNFNQDKMHGHGILYYNQNKPAYDGQWHQDQFHGNGSLFNENPLYQIQAFDYHDFNLVEDYWTKYEGEFVEDNKEGLGRLYLSNGQMFDGQFEVDCINGEGVFWRKNGEKVEGRWENNVMVERREGRG